MQTGPYSEYVCGAEESFALVTIRIISDSAALSGFMVGQLEKVKI